MSEDMVKVWDPLLRVFHWGLVASFAVAWLSAEEWDDLHEYAGYAAAALIGFRLLWGLVGPKYARFRQFLRSPAAVSGYLGSMVRGKEARYLGHNPAGGLMVLALMLAMAGVAASGWMLTLDGFSDLDWVEETHEILANGMLVLVVIHIAGVLLAGFRHHENLVRAMFTGRKRAPQASDVS